MELNGNEELKDEKIEEEIKETPKQEEKGEFDLTNKEDFNNTQSGYEYNLINDIELEKFTSDIFKGVKLKGNGNTIKLTGEGNIINIGKFTTLGKIKFNVEPKTITQEKPQNDEELNKLRTKVEELTSELESLKNEEKVELITKKEIQVEGKNAIYHTHNVGENKYLAKYGSRVENGVYQKVENIFKFRPEKVKVKEVIFDGEVKYKFVGSNSQYTESMIRNTLKECEELCENLNS